MNTSFFRACVIDMLHVNENNWVRRVRITGVKSVDRRRTDYLREELNTEKWLCGKISEESDEVGGVCGENG